MDGLTLVGGRDVLVLGEFCGGCCTRCKEAAPGAFKLKNLTWSDKALTVRSSSRMDVYKNRR